MMDETPRTFSTPWWLGRRFTVTIVAGALLTLAMLGAVSIYIHSQRQRQIARDVESIGGTVTFDFLGPDWIPTVIQEKLPFWNHITDVDLSHRPVTGAALEQLKELPCLYGLDLNHAQITDAELEHVKGLSSLNSIDLSHTSVTDTGLERLKGLTNLNTLFLDEAQNTAKAKASLGKALPHCRLETVVP